ncbi:MAG: CPBP family intramembrane metalloprotease, partial [Bacteroidia bacterium]|nr:CPBP family intramembrane metalloprotease [Bacteroidia bacterium]
MKKFIRQYPVWSFLIINYFISWTFLYPSYRIIENAGQITPMALIGLVGAYGPTVAALIVQYIIDKNQFKTLIKKLIKVRATFKIIAFVIIAPIVFYCLAYLLSAAVYDEALNFNLVYAISNIPFWFLAALPFGPMGEELGWRGFMLPKLLENNSVYKSTIYVGLAWGIWHLASFTFPGAAIPDFFDVSIGTILLYFLNTIALSFVFTYVYLKTKGSVFYAILL